MERTLLVEQLVEYHELQILTDALSVPERRDVEHRIADCEQMLAYLKERFAELNHTCLLRAGSPARLCRVSAADAEQSQTELASMDDMALLRYGSVLRYIVCAEAGLQDIPLDARRAKLGAAQVEWRRRFGKSVIADSF